MRQIDLPTDADPVRLIQGDCLDVLRAMPDGCVDAVVTDPPYNVGFGYEGDASGDRRPDYREWCGSWFAEVRRVCRGPVIVSCGTVNLGMWCQIEQPRWIMCWWKPASTGRCPIGFTNWEPVMVYGDNLPRDLCDVVRTTEQAALPVEHKRQPIKHPCPKPVEWARKLVRSFTPPGGIVLDPFAGSGTTGVAAILEGRRAVLVEREPAYCDIIRKRLAHASGTAPGSLFAGTSN